MVNETTPDATHFSVFTMNHPSKAKKQEISPQSQAFCLWYKIKNNNIAFYLKPTSAKQIKEEPNRHFSFKLLLIDKVSLSPNPNPNYVKSLIYRYIYIYSLLVFPSLSSDISFLLSLLTYLFSWTPIISRRLTAPPHPQPSTELSRWSNRTTPIASYKRRVRSDAWRRHHSGADASSLKPWSHSSPCSESAPLSLSPNTKPPFSPSLTSPLKTKSMLPILILLIASDSITFLIHYSVIWEIKLTKIHTYLSLDSSISPFKVFGLWE